MLSRRGLFTSGLSRLLPVDASPPRAAATATAPRAWPRHAGGDLWAPASAAARRAVPGTNLLDLDAGPNLFLDAAVLPFEDEQFDGVVSAFGPMFSSDGRTAIDELFRVVRPGGIVAFTAWKPLGVVGRLLRLAAAHDPLPSGVPAPLAWGREERLRQELERHCERPRFEPAELALRFASSADAVQRLCAALGPLAVASRPPELRADVADVVAELAVEEPEGVLLRASYLLAIGERSACPILTRSHAQDEDALWREEALQEDRERKDPCASRLHEPHSREEVAEEEALPRQAADPLRS